MESFDQAVALPREAGTAEAILDASAFLFQRQGYHGSPMRQIARYAGVTPAAIYNHFPSKEDLFVAVLRARLPHRAVAEALGEAQGSSPGELVRDAARRMQIALEGRLDNLRLGFVEMLEFEGRHLPQVLPEMLPPALRFVDRLRASHPRLEGWPAPLALRLVGGAFFSFALSASYLQGVEAFEPDLAGYDRLAAFVAAGLIGGAPEAEP